MRVADLHADYDFSGQTAVITGGGGVLGGEMAITLAWFGANVAHSGSLRNVAREDYR